jgi:hypothetical protein
MKIKNFKMGLNKHVQHILVPLVIAGSMQLLSSCQNFKSDHPQAELINQSSTTGMTEKSVIAFAEDIEHAKDNLKKLSSLVYQRGQEKFFVEHYFNDHGDQVFIEHQRPESAIEDNIRRFYLKNDSLILVTATKHDNTTAGKVFHDSRTYLRNYTIFKREVKQAHNPKALTATAYQDQDIKQATEDYKADLQRLMEALNRSGDFELFFDTIVEYPDASFMELKSKTPSGYKATVELQEQDAFIDSLKRDPMHFKAGKINFNWKVEGMDAIYVPSGSPVGSTSTSANGLNR